MPEQLQKIVQPVKSRWDALTKDQKIKLSAAIIIVLIALGLTLYFLLRTEYTVLYDNLDQNDIIPLQEAIETEGIKTQLAQGGTALEVDARRVVDARLIGNTSSILEGQRFTFADALDSIGMGNTTDTNKQIFIREQEDRLGQELTRFDGVQSAVVTLTIPEAMRLFISDSEESRASVQLEVFREVSPSEGEAMAGYLRSSVEGLEMENISITDQEYRIVYSGLQEEAAQSVQGSVAEIKAMEDTAVRNDIRSAFSRIFNDVWVVPNLRYNDVALREEVTERFQLPSGSEIGLPVNESTESFSGENTSPDDAPGTDNNNQEQTTYQAGNEGNSNFEQEQQTVERVYDKIQTTQSQGPGSYIREDSTLSINLYRFRTHFQEQMKEENPEFSEVDWNAHTANTYPRSLNAEDPDIETYKLNASRATGIPVENIDVAVWELPAFEPFAETPVDIPLIIALSLLGLLLLMLAYALIRRQKLVEEEEEAEPELSVEDLLVSTQLEEAQEDAEKLEEIDYAKESEIKKQIEKFVNEKPEAVAALLRNWLNTEEW